MRQGFLGWRLALFVWAPEKGSGTHLSPWSWEIHLALSHRSLEEVN